MITASKLELAMKCEGHLTLPHIDEPNQYSEAGNDRHAIDEAAIDSGRIPPEYDERWPGLTWYSEVAYAYDASTNIGRYLGKGLKRGYGQLAPFEIAGTADAVGRDTAGTLVVVDRKGFDEVTPAASNPQVRFLALAIARSDPSPPSKIYVAIRHEITGMDVAELTEFDLDLTAAQVYATLVNAATVRTLARDGKPVNFVTGRHCRWCPAFSACPKQAELKALVKLDQENPELAIKLYLDEDSAPDVYELYRRVGILHKRLGQSLHAYVTTKRPIQLPGGRMYGVRNKLGNTKLDGDKVWEVLSELHGQDLADRAVSRTATRKRLEEVLKGNRGAAAKALKLVQERGGAKREMKIVFEEYSVGPSLVTDSDDEDT